ncbi:hypothetical protein PROFUN_00294 [Planoprotostelium fungivorum]|uniref:Uncharacterized protein n=1 Tax=Planoprotostelium fungivorum TaxID=1890364 RepID=A0A2P6NXZ6_9EUKA|nr:hypothetical protein PROFUN_00294 [Planoprotostelium fungivorum]
MDDELLGCLEAKQMDKSQANVPRARVLKTMRTGPLTWHSARDIGAPSHSGMDTNSPLSHRAVEHVRKNVIWYAVGVAGTIETVGWINVYLKKYKKSDATSEPPKQNGSCIADCLPSNLSIKTSEETHGEEPKFLRFLGYLNAAGTSSDTQGSLSGHRPIQIASILG